MISDVRLRTTIFKTGVPTLGRTSKSTIFHNFRYERLGDDRKQIDEKSTEVTRNVLTEIN